MPGALSAAVPGNVTPEDNKKVVKQVEEFYNAADVGGPFFNNGMTGHNP